MVNALENAKHEYLEKGRKEGRQEGREEGEKLNAVKVAKAMVEDHLPLDHIVEYSGLSKSEIEDIIKEFQK